MKQNTLNYPHIFHATNINTFLALSGLAEHLQAMLMGRVDIKQNQVLSTHSVETT